MICDRKQPMRLFFIRGIVQSPFLMYNNHTAKIQIHLISKAVKLLLILLFPPILFVTSVDSLDWKDYGVDSIIKTVTEHKHLGNGSIILCHNGAKYTAQALDTLITTLQDKGYELVPISQLIYRDNYHLNHEGRQISSN